jgi:hypothetical protein
MVDGRGRGDGVTPSDGREAAGPELPAALVEYADRLLLSTDLHAEDALLIASGALEPPPELEGLANALAAGWHLSDQPG